MSSMLLYSRIRLLQQISNCIDRYVVCLGGSQVARLGAECAVAGDLGRLHRPGALLPGGPLVCICLSVLALVRKSTSVTVYPVVVGRYLRHVMCLQLVSGAQTADRKCSGGHILALEPPHYT